MRCLAACLFLCVVLPLARGRDEVPQPGRNYTIPGLGLTLVWIAPGSYHASDPLTVGEDTAITLTQGYWLARTETTQAQWQAIASLTPIFQPTPRPSYFKGADLPVEQVSWDMVMAFCTFLSEHERAAGRLPEGYAYTLPTEAQWEYAARAGNTDRVIAGTEDMAWYVANAQNRTHPVASLRPNAWGLYDMYGNVNEWCYDFLAPYLGGHLTDPIGPRTGVYRVIRGGGYLNNLGSSQPGQRFQWQAFFKSRSLGFRLALAPLRPVPPLATAHPKY